MNYTITEGYFGQRPRVELPNPEFLQAIGEIGMRDLISKHYELLKNSQIKELFPPNEQGLAMAKKHAADFFIQICGGPRHFDKSRGAPRMIARHAPFKINAKARIIWLELYAEALKDIEIEESLLNSFWKYLDIFSIWMINQPELNSATSPLLFSKH